MLLKNKKAQTGDVFEPVIKPIVVITAIIIILYIITRILKGML